MYLKKVIIGLFFLFCSTAVYAAGVPSTIIYQGKLTDSGSVPVDGTKNMVFAIYSSASGGGAIWNETQSSVAVSNGIFSVQLGSLVPIDSTKLPKADLWIGVDVGDGEMTPRQKLSSTPFAVRAAVADSVAGDAVMSANIMDGAVATADIADGAITSAKIADGSISWQDISVPLYLSGASQDAIVDVNNNDLDGAVALRGMGYIGVFGRSVDGQGVFAESVNGQGLDARSGYNYGVYATSGTSDAVHAKSTGSSGHGVYGHASASSGTNYGVTGESNSISGFGVHGVATATSGTTYGVSGVSSSPLGYGVYGTNLGGGLAGKFQGGVDITGNLNVATITGDGSSLTGISGLASLSCTTNQIAKWNGSAWVCAADNFAAGVPTGFKILGLTETPPAGYTYTGHTLESNGWSSTTKAAMPTARYRLAVAAANNKIYAIGGNNAGLTTNEEYDPATDSWTTKASMPTGRNDFAAVVVNNKIYAIGGSNYLTTNEEYDPATDSWTTKASMQSGKTSFAAAVVNNKIYAIGSIGGMNEEYDPATNIWTQKATIPTARSGSAAAVANNKIYVIGGTGESGVSSVNEEYDPWKNIWTTKTSMPTARSFLAAVTVNNKVYAIGGADGGYLSNNEEYNPATDSWTTKPAMLNGRYRHAAAVVNNKIYAIGGTGESGSGTANEEYNPATFWYHLHSKD